MRFLTGFVVGWVLLAAILFLFAPKPHKIHTYILFPAGVEGPKLSLDGTAIKADGFCVTVTLHERAETIICGSNFMITEKSVDPVLDHVGPEE